MYTFSQGSLHLSDQDLIDPLTTTKIRTTNVNYSILPDVESLLDLSLVRLFIVLKLVSLDIFLLLSAYTISRYPHVCWKLLYSNPSFLEGLLYHNCSWCSSLLDILLLSSHDTFPSRSRPSDFDLVRIPLKFRVFPSIISSVSYQEISHF